MADNIAIAVIVGGLGLLGIATFLLLIWVIKVLYKEITK